MIWSRLEAAAQECDPCLHSDGQIPSYRFLGFHSFRSGFVRLHFSIAQVELCPNLHHIYRRYLYWFWILFGATNSVRAVSSTSGTPEASQKYLRITEEVPKEISDSAKKIFSRKCLPRASTKSIESTSF